jgi:hypothetical protein
LHVGRAVVLTVVVFLLVIGPPVIVAARARSACSFSYQVMQRIKRNGMKRFPAALRPPRRAEAACQCQFAVHLAASHAKWRQIWRFLIRSGAAPTSVSVLSEDGLASVFVPVIWSVSVISDCAAAMLSVLGGLGAVSASRGL